MINIKKFPFVKQEESKDCGAASLSMIIQYYHGYVGYEELKDLTNITRDGTNAYNLVKAACKIGFCAKGVECSLDDINSDNIILPCIANVIMNKSYKHFIVIYEINFKKKYLVIADPSSKIIKMSFDMFQSIFSGALIIMYPNKVLPIVSKIKLTPGILWNIVKNHKKLLGQIVMTSLLFAICSIVSSFYVESMINGINEMNSQICLVLIFLIFVLIYLMKVVTSFLRDKILILLTQKIDLSLTLDTFKRVLSLPYHYYRNRTTGDIMSRIQDLGIVKNVIGKFLISTVIDLPLSLIALVVLYLINANLCLLVIIMAILYIILAFIFHPIFDKCIYDEHNEKAIVNSELVESISGFETVKGLKIGNSVFDAFERKYVKYLTINGNHQNIYVTQSLLKDLIYSIGFLVITLIGSYYVLNNTISLGNLITFHSLLFYFLDPIQNILSLNHEWKEAKNSIRRVLEMNITEENHGFLEDTMKGTIEYKHVSYTFNDNDLILKDVSFKINEGEKVMIKGISGSGKSTMLKLLMKYYQVDRNNIFINNIDINDYIDSEGIYYINQQELLFTGSILENLKCYDSRIDENKILEISNMCAVDKIVNKNSLGYNMIVEENGFNLSGGERQRIVLARTLLKPFKILIIDEGTNQIDVNLERKILKKVFKYFKDRTILFISHRHNNLDLFDHMIELSDGKIVEDVKYNGKY